MLYTDKKYIPICDWRNMDDHGGAYSV
jgi:hypothetical protein